MPHRVLPPEQLANLRVQAASRLTGAAATKGPPVSASDALAVLHDLASSPATAAGALALLHELQVHQVELALQAEELRESRTELEAALHRQTERYDFQPVGCFSIDRSSVVHELNLCGASMLGIGRDEAYGLPLDSLLSPDSGRALRELISTLAQGKACEPSTLQLLQKVGTDRAVRAYFSADPSGQRFLVVFCD